MPRKKLPDGLPLTERIRRSSQADSTGCWIWQNAVRWSQSKRYGSRYGYGIIQIAGRCVAAHRASYLAFHGEIVPGLCVLHTCDTPRCVNPEHLRLGTHAENMADMKTKGRVGVRDYNRGSAHGMARLTEATVRRIRSLAHLGPCEVARRFGISPSTASQILNRQRWRHI